MIQTVLVFHWLLITHFLVVYRVQAEHAFWFNLSLPFVFSSEFYLIHMVKNIIAFLNINVLLCPSYIIKFTFSCADSLFGLCILSLMAYDKDNGDLICLSINSDGLWNLSECGTLLCRSNNLGKKPSTSFHWRENAHNPIGIVWTILSTISFHSRWHCGGHYDIVAAIMKETSNFS